MLKQLDTLIGFGVVMSMVSLLITIATQMISGFMGLRGMNLVNALEALIQKIDPDIDERVRTRLAERILTDQAISDSMFSMRKWPILQWFSGTWLGTVWKRATATRPDEFLEILPIMLICT